MEGLEGEGMDRKRKNGCRIGGERFDKSVVCRRSPSERTGRRHYGISYSVKLNRGKLERRGARIPWNSRAIIFLLRYRAFVRFRTREPLPRSRFHVREQRYYISPSLVSRVNPASLNRARTGRNTYRLYPFFSLCTSFDKNVAFDVDAGQAGCRARFDSLNPHIYNSLSIVYVYIFLSLYFHIFLFLRPEGIFSL